MISIRNIAGCTEPIWGVYGPNGWGVTCSLMDFPEMEHLYHLSDLHTEGVMCHLSGFPKIAQLFHIRGFNFSIFLNTLQPKLAKPKLTQS